MAVIIRGIKVSTWINVNKCEKSAMRWWTVGLAVLKHSLHWILLTAIKFQTIGACEPYLWFSERKLAAFELLFVFLQLARVFSGCANAVSSTGETIECINCRLLKNCCMAMLKQVFYNDGPSLVEFILDLCYIVTVIQTDDQIACCPSDSGSRASKVWVKLSEQLARCTQRILKTDAQILYVCRRDTWWWWFWTGIAVAVAMLFILPKAQRRKNETKHM